MKLNKKQFDKIYDIVSSFKKEDKIELTESKLKAPKHVLNYVNHMLNKTLLESKNVEISKAFNLDNVEFILERVGNSYYLKRRIYAIPEEKLEEHTKIMKLENKDLECFKKLSKPTKREMTKLVKELDKTGRGFGL